MASAREVCWIFGRGASLDCGLDWVVPSTGSELERDDQIQRTKRGPSKACCSDSVSMRPYVRLLRSLARRSTTGVRHRLLTTNWDRLLEAAMLEAVPGDLLPPWLSDSFVYHLNGSVTDPESSDHVSDFMLESDPRGRRVPRRLTDMAFAHSSDTHVVVCVGLSFECQTDSSLLVALRWSLMPIEISTWFLVNPDRSALSSSKDALARALPRSTVHLVPMAFSEWLDVRFPELVDSSILA